jgi:hypothetical protein
MAPHSPFPVPTLPDLSHVALVEICAWYLVLLTLLVFVAVAWSAATDRREPAAPEAWRAGGDGRRLVLIGVALSFAPLVAWVASRLLTPAFQPRYVLAADLGYAILFTGFCSVMITPRLLAGGSGSRWTSRAAYLGLGLLVAFPAVQAAHQWGKGGTGEKDAQFGYADLPIVVESGYTYLLRVGDGTRPNRSVFLVDADAASVTGNDRAATAFDKILENLKQHFDEFSVERADRFLDAHQPTNEWTAYRLERSGQYRLSRLGRIPDSPLNEVMWLAERIGSPSREANGTTAPSQTPSK